MTDVHIFGTSIMKATLLDPKTQRYRFTAPQWMEKFQQQYPFHVLNHAKFGSTIEKGYRILQANLQKLRPPQHSFAGIWRQRLRSRLAGGGLGSQTGAPSAYPAM